MLSVVQQPGRCPGPERSMCVLMVGLVLSQWRDSRCPLYSTLAVAQDCDCGFGPTPVRCTGAVRAASCSCLLHRNALTVVQGRRGSMSTSAMLDMSAWRSQLCCRSGGRVAGHVAARSASSWPLSRHLSVAQAPPPRVIGVGWWGAGAGGTGT